MIEKEGWYTMIVSKLVYGCGALSWYQRECDDLVVNTKRFWEMAIYGKEERYGMSL